MRLLRSRIQPSRIASTRLSKISQELGTMPPLRLGLAPVTSRGEVPPPLPLALPTPPIVLPGISAIPRSPDPVASRL